MYLLTIGITTCNINIAIVIQTIAPLKLRRDLQTNSFPYVACNSLLIFIHSLDDLNTIDTACQSMCFANKALNPFISFNNKFTFGSKGVF